MRNLFNFLIQYSVLILFLILEVTSIFLVVSNQEYQKSVFLSSSNNVVSGMYEVSNSVVEFFKLRAANDNLSEENTALKNEIILLKNEIILEKLFTIKIIITHYLKIKNLEIFLKHIELKKLTKLKVI